MNRPSRAAELSVSACFLVSALGAGCFIAAYVLSAGGPVEEGLSLGVACTALALGFVLWARLLLPSGTYVEERPPMEPPDSTQTQFVEDLDRGGAQTPGILRRTLGLAFLGLGAAAIVPLRSLLPGSTGPYTALRRTSWARGVYLATKDGERIRARDLAVGSFLTAFPAGRPPQDDATVVVVRLDARELDTPTAQGREGSVDGILAFSKLCTHAGCPVGLYEQTTQQLFCPCHQSVFDVRRKAVPVSGPASRPLAQLPLTVDAAGYLQADGEFDGQVGPTYWRHA